MPYSPSSRNPPPLLPTFQKRASASQLTESAVLPPNHESKPRIPLKDPRPSVTECIVVASESAFHLSLSTALSLFAAGLAPNDIVPGRARGTLEHLAASLSSYAPPPSMPLYLQIWGNAVHCQRPDQRELPLSDVDYAPLLLSLRPVDVARLIALLLSGRAQIIFVSSSIEQLFPAISSLQSLIYPFTWPYPVLHVVPAVLAGSIDSPMPYILGFQRETLPESGVPPSVVTADMDSGTLTIPKNQLEEEVLSLASLFLPHVQAAREKLDAVAERAMEKSEVIQQVIAPGAWGSASAGRGASTQVRSTEASKRYYDSWTLLCQRNFSFTDPPLCATHPLS